MRVLDLYCGMGGLSLGAALALEDSEIYGVDIDGHAIETYNLNLSRFGCWAERADLLAWELDGEYDIVVGGPPCQPFSLANTKKVGDSHPLYPTFHRYFDLVRAIRPAAFVFENVRGLLTRRFRHLLDAQLRGLSDRYRIRHAILNAAYYGVPQKRERLIVVGVRRDIGSVFTFPRPTHAEAEASALTHRLHRWLTVREAIGDLLDNPPTIIHRGHSGGRKTSLVSDSPSYTVGTMSGNGRSRTTMYLLVPDHIMTERGGSTYGPWEWGCRVIPSDRPSTTITEKHRSGQMVIVPWTPYQDKHPPLSMDEPSRTVWSHVSKASRGLLAPLGKLAPAILSDGNLRPDGHHDSLSRSCIYRRLTVRECMRLQSFPDWWRFPGSVSVSKRYKLVGEAIPPILAYRIAVAFGKALGLPVKEPPRDEDWGLPYFRRAFADYFDGVGQSG
jgi:DNA (cytosine-5)-methyltransferase 1